MSNCAQRNVTGKAIKILSILVESRLPPAAVRRLQISRKPPMSWLLSMYAPLLMEYNLKQVGALPYLFGFERSSFSTSQGLRSIL